MLRLRAPIQSNVLTPACFKHSWKGLQKDEIGVTAMLSYEQVNVRNGSWPCNDVGGAAALLAGIAARVEAA